MEKIAKENQQNELEMLISRGILTICIEKLDGGHYWVTFMKNLAVDKKTKQIFHNLEEIIVEITKQLYDFFSPTKGDVN